MSSRRIFSGSIKDLTVGGRYEIKDPPIGQGEIGVVYKAYDTVTHRYVALKVSVPR